MDEASASRNDSQGQPMSRRVLIRRLAATSAVAWAAPQILATERAAAGALSGCYTDFDFDDGTLQGWTANNAGPAGWRLDTRYSTSGSYSVWFGRRNSSDSLHPIVGQPSYNHNERSSRGTLTSPSTTASATDVICFNVRLAIENAVAYDVFRLYVVQGGTRVQLWDKHQPGFTVIDHPQNPPSQWDLYTTSGTWILVTVPVGTPSGIDLSSPVQFEFDFQTVDGAYNRTEGIYLDNILLPCASGVSTPSIPQRGGSSATLAPPTESGFQPGYRPPPKVRPPDPPREAPTTA